MKETEQTKKRCGLSALAPLAGKKSPGTAGPVRGSQRCRCGDQTCTGLEGRELQAVDRLHIEIDVDTTRHGFGRHLGGHGIGVHFTEAGLYARGIDAAV